MIGTLLNGDYFPLNYLLKDLKFDNLPWIRLLGSTPSTWDNVFWNSVARSIPEILLTTGRVCQLALVIASIGAVTAIYGYRKYGKLLADMSEARVLELSDAYHLLKEQKLKHHYSPSIYCRLRGRVALPPKVTPLVAEISWRQVAMVKYHWRARSVRYPNREIDEVFAVPFFLKIGTHQVLVENAEEATVFLTRTKPRYGDLAVEWVLSNHMEATVIGDLYINSAGHLALRKAKDRTFLVSVLPDTVLERELWWKNLIWTWGGLGLSGACIYFCWWMTQNHTYWRYVLFPYMAPYYWE